MALAKIKLLGIRHRVLQQVTTTWQHHSNLCMKLLNHRTAEHCFITTKTLPGYSINCHVLRKTHNCQPRAPLWSTKCSLHSEPVQGMRLLPYKHAGQSQKKVFPRLDGHLCGFHTSQQRHIPPVLWIFLKPVAKIGAIITGRTARNWWKTLTPEKREGHWLRLKQRWYLLAGLAVALVCAQVAYYMAHVEETPMTGRKRFMAVTHEQFLKICESEANDHLDTFKGKILPATHPHSQKLSEVGSRIFRANYSEIHDLMGDIEWKCYIVNDKRVNAFVLPTGHIFVFTGIMDMIANDDQLAIVLAHEMAHALLSHGIETVSYSQLLDWFIIIAMAAIWFFMPNDGISLVSQWFHNKFISVMLHLPYSRQLEKEADKVGIQLAARACYDVREGSVFWSNMTIVDDIGELLGEDKVNFPEFFRTHPSNETRVKFFDHLVPHAEEIRTDAKCPVLPTKDPREQIKILSARVTNLQTARLARQNLAIVKKIDQQKTK